MPTKLVVFGLVAVLASCSNLNDPPNRAVDLPDMDLSTGSDGPAPTFGYLDPTYFFQQCSGCHSDGCCNGLDLSPGMSYMNLVNAPASEAPMLKRVLPGDPDNSYLIMKLRGMFAQGGTAMPLDPHTMGGQMPLGGPYLDDATIQLFVDWIKAGASMTP